MNKLTTTLLATALVSIIGATVLTSAVSAQEGPQSPPRMTGFMQGFGGAGRLCAPDSVERLDEMLSRAAQRIDLSAEQTDAFEVFRGQALAAQSKVANTCIQVAPGANADLIDRLNAGQEVMTVRLEGMTNVLPSLESLYDSLSDEQKAKIRPMPTSQRHMLQRQGSHQDQGPHAPGTP